ncbi:MAG TPA: family 43 glycosylhydrolase, partial [Terriglobales bacterium]|nr:family 43 glycosylhydrolase [Terriglobales bacterium]
MRCILSFLACWAIASLLLLTTAAARGHKSGSAPRVFSLEGDVQGTHDPSMARDGDTWYLFATGASQNPPGQLPIRCSSDLRRWRQCGRVLREIPAWIRRQSPTTRDLWAPDISYFNGKYHLYYAFSVFGKNTSGIALLTNST